MAETVETKVTPENEIQELWELNGRVAATLAYLRREPYTNREIVIDMLVGGGGQAGEDYGSDL